VLHDRRQEDEPEHDGEIRSGRTFTSPCTIEYTAIPEVLGHSAPTKAAGVEIFGAGASWVAGLFAQVVSMAIVVVVDVP
jgi:hypothetical protein